MDYKLKCKICKKTFYGDKKRLYCSKDCELAAKRKRRKKEKINSKTEQERRREYNKKYYLKSRHLMTKKYQREQENKKRKEKEYGDQWIKDNQIKRAEYRKRSRIRKRGWFDDYKKTLKCEVCGYDKCPEALDFHHKDGKKKEMNISQSLNRKGKEEILKELEKCIVLCANCHREFHYNEKMEEYNRRQKEYLKVLEEDKKKREIFSNYYKIVEVEFESEWIEELKKQAKHNLIVFGGNQYIKRDNGIKKRINIKIEISKKTGVPEGAVKRSIQIYNRGTEDQKRRAREGIDSINKIYRELEPIRYSKNFLI